MKMLQGVVAALCLVSVSSAETTWIATINARGDFRVDNYPIKSNATLFNGSVVETGVATADLRFSAGTRITMAPHSRGTTYRDHLLLQEGESEIAGSGLFQVQANGLHIVANQPNSDGVLSVKDGGEVEVSALSGGFRVTSENGVALAKVHPGNPLIFSTQAGSSITAFSGSGKVSVVDGHYYLIVKGTGTSYELTGNNLAKLVGKEVKVIGSLLRETPASGGATGVVAVQTATALAAGVAGTTVAVIAGVSVAAGVGLGVGIYEADQVTPTASR